MGVCACVQATTGAGGVSGGYRNEVRSGSEARSMTSLCTRESSRMSREGTNL